MPTPSIRANPLGLLLTEEQVEKTEKIVCNSNAFQMRSVRILILLPPVFTARPFQRNQSACQINNMHKRFHRSSAIYCTYSVAICFVHLHSIGVSWSIRGRRCSVHSKNGRREQKMTLLVDGTRGGCVWWYWYIFIAIDRAQSFDGFIASHHSNNKNLMLQWRTAYEAKRLQ